MNKCLPHSLLFFFLGCDRICTLVGGRAGRIEKEKGGEGRSEEIKEGRRKEKRKKKEDAIFMSHIYSDTLYTNVITHL